MTSSVDSVPTSKEQRIRRVQTIRVVAVFAILAVMVLFAFDNREDVSAGWVIGDGQAPLYVLLVGSWVLGLLVGQLTAWRRHRR